MSLWGSVSAGLQDNGGVGLSDPYSDTNNIGSSFSTLATSLVGAAANVGESYAVSQVSGGSVIATGNPLAPTTVIPSLAQAQQVGQISSAMNSGKVLEYGIVAVIGVLIAVAVLR